MLNLRSPRHIQMKMASRQEDKLVYNSQSTSGNVASEVFHILRATEAPGLKIIYRESADTNNKKGRQNPEDKRHLKDQQRKRNLQRRLGSSSLRGRRKCHQGPRVSSTSLGASKSLAQSAQWHGGAEARTQR